MGKPLKIHVTDQQSFHPVLEHNLSQGTDPHKCGVPGGGLQRTVSLVLYEDIWRPDVGSDPVLAFDLRDVSCQVVKPQPGVLNIQGKLSIVFVSSNVASTFHLCRKSRCVSNSKC